MKKHSFIFPLMAGVVLAGCTISINNTPTEALPVVPMDEVPPVSEEPWLAEEEAKEVAEAECIKGGESIGSGYYNEHSKTWWFDANLNVQKEGCRPACVVFLDGTWEINWRCTGLMMDKEDIVPIITSLFIKKFPEYADVLTIDIQKQTGTHARGNVSFGQGVPGGYFLARKTDNEWEIVQDGNGAIPCSLSEKVFPKDMISDCYEDQ